MIISVDQVGNAWQGKPVYSEETCPNAALSTTDPTWLDLGSNSDCHSRKCTTNHQNYDTTSVTYLLHLSLYYN
jgi:hypothetical protein